MRDVPLCTAIIHKTILQQCHKEIKPHDGAAVSANDDDNVTRPCVFK